MSKQGEATAAEQGHGGQIAARTLRNHGVDRLFTLSGGHLFSLYDGCVKESIELIDVRHEQTAVFAAEGYAKVTRKPGIAALTAGPGVTNGISAIASAHFTGSPVVVLGGRAPGARWGQGSLQEIDHVPLVAPITRHAATSRETGAIGGDVARALEKAATPHRGPTFLDVPMDLFFASDELPAARTTPLTPGGPVTSEGLEGPVDEERVLQIAGLLDQAERPVLMVGADVYWAGAELALRNLAEAANVPVFLNGLGRGCLPADHPNFFSRCRKTAFTQADLVIVVGTPLDFRLGFGRFGTAQVVHVMETSERIAGHVDLAGSASGSLEVILETIAGRCRQPQARGSWLETLGAEEKDKRSSEQEALQTQHDPIKPTRIYGELREALDRDAIVIGDGGDFVSYAGKYVETFEPGCFLDPGPYGCLGTGAGYALGAATAHPDRQVVLLLGDGAAGFSMGDWDTLIRFGCNVTIVVGNNLCWGLEKHPMKQFFGYHVAAELSPDARYDKAFEGLGGSAALVETPDALQSSLRDALAERGPVLLNVLTDPEDVYPRSSNLG